MPCDFKGGIQGGMIVISLGSNISGNFGTPAFALRRAIAELKASRIEIIHTSQMYITEAYSYTPQPDFLNAIVTVAAALPPDALLQVLKRIEARAGRVKQKSGYHSFFHWMPRPLDLDIVNYKNMVCHWKGKFPKVAERVILPHPRAHERAFVLRPLAEVAPSWHHPVFGLTAAQLLKQPAVRNTGKIKGSQDFLGY
ncbi:MAG: 2-amino-4-hydroxy-6-hydroxymethyldihydropteridine diphosphokinase [Rhodomicrobium sp.]